MSRLIALICLIGLAACQMKSEEAPSSGADYIADRRDVPGYDIDKEIAAAAAVEPNLRFPARIGVARIVDGRLALPPEAEAELLAGIVKQDAGYGDFFTIGPLMAALAAGTSLNSDGTFSSRSKSDLVQDIRLTAARQHLDYVLIYEIAAHSRETGTPFALADVTLIGGAVLPTRNIRVAGVGQALFLDVRNGYPYASASAARDISGLARSFGTYRRTRALRARAVSKVAEALMPEIGTMLQGLLQGTQR